MTKLNNLAGMLILVCMFATISCKKKKDPEPEPETSLPSISTSPVSSVLNTSALGGGAVISEGSDAVTAKGICWDTLPEPSLTRGTVQTVTGANNYTCAMTGLKTYKKYYVRAFATNSNGTAYGNELTFTSADIWNRVKPMGMPAKITAMKAKGSDVYMASYTGVLYSPDKGNTWLSAGLTNSVISGIGIGSDAVFVSANSSIFKSTDHGATWNNVFTVPAAPFFGDILISGNDVYAAMYGAVYLSHDSGASWAKTSNGLPTTLQDNKFAANATGVFLCAGNSLTIYKLNDTGTGWTVAGNLPASSSAGISSMVCAGNVIIVSQSTGNCHLSKDNGLSWEKCIDLPNNRNFFSVAESGEVFSVSASAKCNLSINSGTSWTPLSTNGLIPSFSGMSSVLITDYAFFIGSETEFGFFRLRR